MAIDYNKVWNAMNELDNTITNFTQIKQLLDNYNKNDDKFLNCITTLLEHFIEVQDEAFKVAWKETVGSLRGGDSKVDICDINDTSEHCKKSWVDFWEEIYYPEEISKEPGPYQKYVGWKEVQSDDFEKEFPSTDSIKKWVLPVEIDGPSGEYFLTLPDDLLDSLGWEEDDSLEWIDNGDGSFRLCKGNSRETK